MTVTTLILLISQEPTKLSDAHSNQWQWRMQGTIKPHLADILDKLLLPVANQQFQSAYEVLEALSYPLILPTVLPLQQRHSNSSNHVQYNLNQLFQA
ncbi:hypothetical protein FNW02_13655 [Komarekiella sp. 'clone 1']|uniref:Uncharacterized protein n=1 Tax=Komarekiella delphini-convector SJRDD-AB1 TaxID=2593771 RepID=A0AA40VS00_9NOST|nr:hypothetical protein [Komarekiella delphini-convector]MBD6616846.1 hypothetical protein [Komarekiella delphini-convector SJRDD-AB1]